MVRGKDEEAGIRKLTEGLCNGGRVDTGPGGKIARLHRPVAFSNILEVGHFPGRKAQAVTDLHGVLLSGDPHECLVCTQILILPGRADRDPDHGPVIADKLPDITAGKKGEQKYLTYACQTGT